MRQTFRYRGLNRFKLIIILIGADTSYWIKFFTDCGIPPSESTNYAITFTDNRIQKDMLMDLTKEYLSEMGIQILGDVIAILKHAKTVHSQVQYIFTILTDHYVCNLAVLT